MEGGLSMSRGKILVAAVAGLFAAYQVISPFMKETDRMRAESAKIGTEIQQLKADLSSYDEVWEKKMAAKEAQMQKKIPDVINSASVLDYFLTRFDSAHPNRIFFTSVTHQPGVAAEIKVKGVKGNNLNPRLSRYKIISKVAQDTVVSYLDHIEKYEGMCGIENFALNLPKKGGGPLIDMEATIGFYLSPKDWVPPDKLGEDAGNVSLERGEEQNWFQIFSADGNRTVANSGDGYEKYPRFKVDQIVGESIVVLEQLYEEGDFVQGWKVMRIEEDRKSVILKKGGITRRLSIQ
jgi:hypothetical protein